MREMKEELQLRLQAYLDGELPDGEGRAMAELIARDADARALVAELRNTRGALKGFESETKLPESREFYWSKIEREIGRSEKPQTAAQPASVSALLRRFLAPVGAVAALVIVGILITRQNLAPGSPESATAFADSDAFTYRDYSAGMTLVWVSYPAENGFADFSPEDTLD
jgi:anti-sigma factor RsiW